MFLFLENISCILVAGAFDSKIVEVLIEEFGTIRLPNLPFDVYSNPSIFVQNGTNLLCGGNYTENWNLALGRDIALLMSEEFVIQL